MSMLSSNINVITKYLTNIKIDIKWKFGTETLFPRFWNFDLTIYIATTIIIYGNGHRIVAYVKIDFISHQIRPCQHEDLMDNFLKTKWWVIMPEPLFTSIKCQWMGYDLT